MDSKYMEDTLMENTEDNAGKDGPIDVRQPWFSRLPPKKQLKVLEKEARKALDSYNVLSDRMEEIKRAVHIPQLRAKYEGKYWKSTDNDKEDCLYGYCRHVVDGYMGDFDVFSMNTVGCGFRTAKQTYAILCVIEITRSEYLEQLMVLTARMQAFTDKQVDTPTSTDNLN